MAEPKRQLAKLLQVLEYVDGPQAVLLGRDKDRRVIAVAIDKPPDEYPFFGAGISRAQWESYRRGEVDLRELFEAPDSNEWFFFDIGRDPKDRIKLIPAKRTAKIEASYFPAAGFYARDHSEPVAWDDAETVAIEGLSQLDRLEIEEFLQQWEGGAAWMIGAAQFRADTSALQHLGQPHDWILKVEAASPLVAAVLSWIKTRRPARDFQVRIPAAAAGDQAAGREIVLASGADDVEETVRRFAESVKRRQR